MVHSSTPSFESERDVWGRMHGLNLKCLSHTNTHRVKRAKEALNHGNGSETTHEVFLRAFILSTGQFFFFFPPTCVPTRTKSLSGTDFDFRKNLIKFINFIFHLFFFTLSAVPCFCVLQWSMCPKSEKGYKTIDSKNQIEYSKVICPFLQLFYFYLFLLKK